MRGYDVEVGPCYSGDATIELHDSPVEELTRLAPIEVIGGLLAGGRHELARRHDARARPTTCTMTGPGPDGDLGPADADIADPDTYVAGVPHATFLRLRRDDPVSWWGEDHAGGAGFWAVTRHADLLAGQPRRRHVLQRPGHPPRGDGRRGDRGPAHDDGARPARRTPATAGWCRSRSAAARSSAYEQAIRTLARSVIDDALAAGDVVRLRRPPSPSSCRCACSARCSACPTTTGRGSSSAATPCSATPIPEFTTHPVGLVDTDEFRLMPFRSPAGIELFRYAQEQARQRREHPTDDVISDLLAPEDRRRGAQRARVQQLLHAARGRRQRHDALHDDGRDQGADRTARPAGRAARRRRSRRRRRRRQRPSRRSSAGAR